MNLLLKVLSGQMTATDLVGVVDEQGESTHWLHAGVHHNQCGGSIKVVLMSLKDEWFEAHFENADSDLLGVLINKVLKSLFVVLVKMRPSDSLAGLGIYGPL